MLTVTLTSFTELPPPQLILMNGSLFFSCLNFLRHQFCIEVLFIQVFIIPALRRLSLHKEAKVFMTKNVYL